MNHGGPMTAVQKKLLLMRAAEAAAKTNQPASLATGPQAPLLPAVYNHSSSASSSLRAEQSLISYADVEMEDAAPSTPANYSYFHAQPTFSPAAKPFVPPSAITPVTMAAPSTAVRRLPPHRANQSHAPSIPAAAISASASPAPDIKTEPPASPALSTRSSIPPHKRSAGPHAKLGPHAQKPSAAAQMQPPNHHLAPGTVETHSPLSPQDVLVNLQSPKSAEKPLVATDPWVELEGLKVKTEPEPAATEHSSAYVEVKSESQASEAATTIVPSLLSKCGTAAALDKRALTESTVVNSPAKTGNGVHRFGRNEWLPMLLAMNDTDKGCQLIRAFSDHIRAGVDGSDTGDSIPSTQQELFMEFPDGSGLTATVPLHTTVSAVVKDLAKMAEVKQSDISIVLKVRINSHGN